MTVPRDVLRETWRRHGVPEPMFGVKFGDLEELRERLGRDQTLARALATMIAAAKSAPTAARSAAPEGATIR